jgi:hypothetical protein
LNIDLALKGLNRMGLDDEEKEDKLENFLEYLEDTKKYNVAAYLLSRETPIKDIE